MCALPSFFFIVEPCPEFTCYLPLVLCHSFSFSGQRSTMVPGHSRTKHSSPWIGSFRPFLLALLFLFLFLPTDHSQSSVTVVCVLRASSCWWKKIWLPNVMCFRRRHSIRMANACLKKANPRTESYTSFSRTPSVDRPYAFGAFPSSLWSLQGLRRSAFLFQHFFVSPLKQKWHKSVIRNDTKSVTSKPEHVRLFLLFDCWWSPTACQSMTFLQHVQDSSALSMLTKTYML